MHFDLVELIVGVIGALFGAGGATAVTPLALRRYEERNALDPRRLQAVMNIARENAYINLMRIHRNAVAQGWCDARTREFAEELYENYTALGGNGFGTSMIDEIRHMPAYDPRQPPPTIT